MDSYKIADLIFNIECSGKTKKQAQPYLIPYTDNPDYVFKISNEGIEKFKQAHPNSQVPDWEYFLMSIKLCSCLLENNGMILHSSAVALNNEAYLFSADSGVGKSTHTNLWKRCFKDAYIINDDKPAIRLIDGNFYVYGTPWSGSSPLNENVKVPLKAICFIERGSENEISKITDKLKLLELIMTQTLRRAGEVNTGNLLNFVGKIIENVPIYKLKCLPNEDAAILAHKVMSE